MKPCTPSDCCFYRDARAFITRLINLQRHIPAKYKRSDMAAMLKCMVAIERQLSFYPYDSDLKMKRFWTANRNAIRLILPTNRHPAFAKMITEFEQFDSIAIAEYENTIWNTVASAFNKF
jgi:hypothetical protein